MKNALDFTDKKPLGEERTLDYYLAAFGKMNRAVMRGVKAPHKPLLLLAIINLYRQDVLTDNHIMLSDELIAEFKRLWREYIGEPNSKESVFVAEGLAMDVTTRYPFKCSIENPYYHLQNEPFWRLVKREGVGDEKKYYSSIKALRTHFAYAEIDQELFELITLNETAIVLKTKLQELLQE